MKKIILSIILISAVALSQGLPVATTIAPPSDDGAIRWFGWSIATGDFNGDGYGDVAIGAPRSDRPPTHPDSALGYAGRVDIYFGPIPEGFHDGFSLPPDLTLYGADSSGQLGISVANAGDFNGDGYDDLLVGANAVRGIGEAYIYFGGPAMADSPDYTFTGIAPADNFGYSCTGIGDQNGDGYDDVLVGALYNDAIGPRTGQCYIFFGGDPADTSADFVITGLDSLDDFGVVMDGPFDFNGDGQPDFVIGAVQAGGYWFKPGEGYVFYGGSLLDENPDWTITGTHPMEFFGGGASALGDVDRDGYDDALFAGYNHHNPPDSGLGRAVLLFGGTGDTLTLIGDMPGQFLGSEIASAGDLDGDNRAEFAISQAIDGNGDDFGFVKIYGVATLPDSSREIQVDTVIYNPAARSDTWFGYRMASLLDIDGDSYPDFAVTDPRMPNDPGLYETQGRVYIYNGWRVLFPIFAEVINPLGGGRTACPRHGTEIRLRQEFGLVDLSVILSVESDSGTHLYTLDSTSLEMINDTTLLFTPTRDWNHGEEVVITLTSADMPSGEELDTPVSDSWKADLQAPIVEPLILDFRDDDPYPVFYWIVTADDYDEELEFLDDAFVFYDGDSIHPSNIFDVEIEGATARKIVAVPLSELGLRVAYADSVTMCISGIHDDPDMPCGPNIADVICQTRYFIRAWTADLSFESSGLEPTVLTIGALPGMTDAYDPGGDIILPPIPAGRLCVRLSLASESIPAYNSLLRDLRGANDDTIQWLVITEGSGSAAIRWNPDLLPSGKFIIDGRTDMRSVSEYGFSLGDTIEIEFTIGPKTLYSVDLHADVPRWQMVSSPLYLDNPSMSLQESFIDALFEGAEKWIYTFDSETGIYENPDKWPTGKGLWFYIAPDDVSGGWNVPLVLAGWPIDTLKTPIHRGWNQIGAPISEVPDGEIGAEPSGALIPGTLFGFGETGDYYFADALTTGEGFWILSTADGDLFAPRRSSTARKSLSAIDLTAKFGAYPPMPPGVTVVSEKPQNHTLGIFPNPFNAACRISLPEDFAGDILIFDISGRKVRSFIDAGSEIIWQGEDNSGEELPNGVYLIKAGNEAVFKAVLLR
ncbi:MAG: hypothetical protein ACP5G4_01450 [bacterium]